MGTILLYATLTMLGLAALFCLTLIVANIKLAVHVDPVQSQIEVLLPGANCGGCGYPGCSAFAKAVFEKKAAVNGCGVGGPSLSDAIAKVLGVDATTSYPYRPVIHCGATEDNRLGRGRYTGERTCGSANVIGGVQGCTYGCLGFGDCVESCKYGAMKMVAGLPVIDYAKCIGCGACLRACPRNIIEMIPFKVERMMTVACSNHDPAKAVREVCKVGCLGCSACARILPEVFKIVNNLSTIDYDKYTGNEDFVKAREKCPMESMIYFGKPSAEQLAELAGVDAVTIAGPPASPQHPTPEDLNWRG